jgi:membrane associated rhomboid family serine protease
MGIYDRHYIRTTDGRDVRDRGSPGGGVMAGFRAWSVTTWIIVICAAIFVIDGFLPMTWVETGNIRLAANVQIDLSQVAVGEVEPQRVEVRVRDEQGRERVADVQFRRPLLAYRGGPEVGWVEVAPMRPIESFLHFSTLRGFWGLEVWRFVGFQFLHSHAGIAHILFNMLGLFFFGPMVERYLGSKRYLAFYLMCGICGAISYLLLNLGGSLASWFLGSSVRIPGLLFTDGWVPLVGASAGVFGVIMAGAFLAPNAIVYMFYVLPMRLRTVAYVLVAIALWTVFTSGRNAGGEAAHLGGAIAGFCFIRRPHLLHGFLDILGRADPTSHHYRAKRGGGGAAQASRRTEIDRILDKISASGLHSLTDAEKRALQEVSDR